MVISSACLVAATLVTAWMGPERLLHCYITCNPTRDGLRAATCMRLIGLVPRGLRQVYLGNLDDNVDERDIDDAFGKFGRIRCVTPPGLAERASLVPLLLGIRLPHAMICSLSLSDPLVCVVAPSGSLASHQASPSSPTRTTAMPMIVSETWTAARWPHHYMHHYTSEREVALPIVKR